MKESIEMKKGYSVDLSKVDKIDQRINFSIREKVNSWHNNNVSTYQKFLRNFEKMSITNIDFASKLFRVFADNIPKETEEVWSYFFANTDDMQTPSLLDKYETVLDTCLEGDNCFGVDLSTGEVKLHSNSNPEKMQYLLDNGKFYVYVVRTVRKFVNAVDEQTAVINARDKELQQAKADGNEEKYWRIFHNNKLCAEEMCRDIMYGN